IRYFPRIAVTYSKLKPLIFMPPPLFPPEILQNSRESYFSDVNNGSRWLYLTLLLLLFLTLILLPLLRVDLSVQSPGVIRGDADESPIIPIVAGEVVRNLPAEYSRVRKNDTLLLLSTEKIDREISLEQMKIRQDRQLMADIDCLLSGRTGPFGSSWADEEFNACMAMLGHQQVAADMAEEEHRLASLLFEKGIIPRHELETTAAKARIETGKFVSVLKSKRVEWQEKKKSLAMNLEEEETRVKQMKEEKSQYCLLSPVDGIWIGNPGIRKGNFVVANQQIAKISPDDHLSAECYVTPSEIGQITTGMTVTFQVHSFNYHQWGLAGGKVLQISDNVVQINNTPFFKVKCSLDRTSLHLRNGWIGKLRKGMSLTGRFRLVDRTLLQLLYDKAENWLDPKMMDHEN
ncbi:MAG: HlyD family secretion protein, partial [Marinilabiliales bacterium]|nr:HlyD family secretion protein [Marinilabiliales bacterium]